MLTLQPVVEIDLTSPAMFPGKKGFDRLIYACENVLNRRLTWLFYNTEEKSESLHRGMKVSSAFPYLTCT
jgi:hypothetical protein